MRELLYLTLTVILISIAIKRIMQEAKELANDPSPEYTAAPLEVSQAIRHSRNQ